MIDSPAFINRLSQHAIDEHIFYKDDIPAKKANTVMRLINKHDYQVDMSEIIFLIDDTRFGSAKQFFIMTADGFYYKSRFKKMGFFELQRVNHLSVSDGHVLMVNQQAIYTFSQPTEEALIHLFSVIDSYLKKSAKFDDIRRENRYQKLPESFHQLLNEINRRFTTLNQKNHSNIATEQWLTIKKLVNVRLPEILDNYLMLYQQDKHHAENHIIDHAQQLTTQDIVLAQLQTILVFIKKVTQNNQKTHVNNMLATTRYLDAIYHQNGLHPDILTELKTHTDQ